MATTKRMPPLAWIRVFREAGRHGTFKAAAQALHLAPSTISHEIRKLEEWLGKPLFDRQGRQLTLTDEGAQLLSGIEAAFDILEQSFAQLGPMQSQPIKIGMLPFVGSELLLPLFDEWHKGDRPLVISSHNRMDALSAKDPRDRVDAVITYLSQPPVGYVGVCLTRVALCLVHGKDRRQSLRRIRVSGSFDAWQLFDDTALPARVNSAEPIVVDNYLAAMSAVEQGLGIGVGVLPLCYAWLRTGRINMLADHPQSIQPLTIQHRYWMLWRKDTMLGEELNSIAQLLSAEFEQYCEQLKLSFSEPV